MAELRGGWENLNLLITCDGERLVLRRYDVTPPEEVRWEMALLRFLGERQFPTAQLIERADGALAGTFTGKSAAIFHCVAGRHPAWNTPGIVEQAGHVIARLHALTSGLTLPYPRSRLHSQRRIERFQDWWQMRRQASDEPALALLAEQAGQSMTSFAQRLGPCEAALPRGVVHHDAHPGNLICDEAGRLVALLDFDDAHETHLLADVAVLLDVWGTDHRTHRFSPARATAVLRAYTRHRPLGMDEWELLPDFLALYRLADATSYVTSRVQRGIPAYQALADCHQYAKYRQLTAEPDWQDRLRAVLRIVSRSRRS